jgi:GTPase-activating protein BEM2
LRNGGGPQDIVDDNALYLAFKSFLENPSDHSMPESQYRDDAEVIENWTSLRDRIHALSILFTSQTLRPSIPKAPTQEEGTNPAGTLNFVDVLDFDRVTLGEFISECNAMGAAAFRGVTEEVRCSINRKSRPANLPQDLLTTADLLEIQSADRTGWFLSRDTNSTITNEDVEIQTIYSHLMEVSQSPLISELSQDPFYCLLPPTIRSCLRAHHVLRKWLVSKIVEPRIGSQTRQARMEFLLHAVEMCRDRDRSDFDHSRHASAERRCIRTFVEFILTSAILSPESRMYSRAWSNVANTRRAGLDSLVAMLVRPNYRPSRNLPDLITDMGWTLERMLEILNLPDVLASPTDASGLVNFHKRR